MRSNTVIISSAFVPLMVAGIVSFQQVRSSTPHALSGPDYENRSDSSYNDLGAVYHSMFTDWCTSVLFQVISKSSVLNRQFLRIRRR